jgi:hypothetical protein
MIRSNTLVQDYEYISRFDEAVDSGREDFEHAWKLYLDGAGDCPLKAGVEPTRFKLRHITSSERVYLLELHSNGEHGLMVAAAAMALVGAKNLSDGEGKPAQVAREVTEVGPLKIAHATKASVDLLPPDVILELGSVVLDRMRLRPSS